ncbi:inosine-uridine preferring nucleoside hydrolase-like isoform X4 [Amphiura filiformis]|uniref:inosine-uridine preferring nucleoside hydrolase-like isoform X4 n=1 Tax=Amphiura filiformis TaxID=82378 RepID=UPI003B21655C
MASKCTMVLDTDVGTDDAVALLMALSQPSVDLIGVTCVHGNTSLDNVLVNTLRVLKLCNRLDVPVYKGTACPLISSNKRTDASFTHGSDGMGGIPDPHPPSRDLIQSEHAVNALIRMANEHPGEISLVAIGPLTNLALATKMDPEFSKKLKELVIMGGNIEGRGNRPGAEFNFFVDPEAAYITLQEYTCPITVVPWDTCVRNGLTWEWYDQWTSTDTVKGHFVRDILKRGMTNARTFYKRHLAPIFDPLTMAVVINRSIVSETKRSPVLVEVKGDVTRGQMVQVDASFVDHPKNGREVDIVLKCDADGIKEMLMKAVE